MSESRSAVAIRRGGVPEIHLHPRPFAVGRRREIRVVDRAAVLCLRIERVAANAAVAEVVGLEVAR